MGSTSSLFIGLTGLNANARAIDVIGNNIANVNTTGFKSVRLNFSNQLSRTLREGSPPEATTGGTNPTQIGQGVGIAGTTRNFQPGARTSSGDGRDLAIEGQGLFPVERGNETLYTRVGNFRTDSENLLTSIDGDRVLGYPIDGNFNVQVGELTPISIPIGTLTVAEATTRVNLAGNLNADGDASSRGSTHTFADASGSGFGLIPAATVAPTAPNVLETTSLLSELEDPSSAGSSLFAVGNTIRITGAERGTRIVPDATLPVTAATTVQDYIDFVNATFELDPTAGANPDGSTPGLALDPLTGIFSLVGNTGTNNDIVLDAQDIRIEDSSGLFVGQPFTPTRTATADGESVRTSFVAYDSLGTPLSVDMTFVLSSKDATGTTWSYRAESGDDTTGSRVGGEGTVRFDTLGRIIGPTPVSVSIDRDGTGAGTPLTFEVNFDRDGDEITALTDTESNVFATFQNGAPIGTLASYSVAPDGRVVGSFTNQLVRDLGQITVAKFTVPEGLVEVQDNLYRPGPNSGPAVITEPGRLGTGRLVSGALELSNVELGEEFIGLILASTGYSASSRVIRTSDDLIQELLTLGR